MTKLLESSSERSFRLEILASLRCVLSDGISVGMAGFRAFTLVQISGASILESALDHMLRSCDIHEDIITDFRIMKIETAEIFAVKDSTPEELKVRMRSHVSTGSRSFS